MVQERKGRRVKEEDREEEGIVDGGEKRYCRGANLIGFRVQGGFRVKISSKCL